MEERNIVDSAEIVLDNWIGLNQKRGGCLLYFKVHQPRRRQLRIQRALLGSQNIQGSSVMQVSNSTLETIWCRNRFGEVKTGNDARVTVEFPRPELWILI